jgi:hypothetical protein
MQQVYWHSENVLFAFHIISFTSMTILLQTHRGTKNLGHHRVRGSPNFAMAHESRSPVLLGRCWGQLRENRAGAIVVYYDQF